MKNNNNHTRPAEIHRPRTSLNRPQRDDHRFTPKAPHHDFLVLSFYPGMDTHGVRTGQATAA